MSEDASYLAELSDCVNYLSKFDVNVFNEAFLGWLKNPNKSNENVVRSNLNALVDNLTTIIEGNGEIDSEEELEDTLQILTEYTATSKYGYGKRILLEEVKEALKVIQEYFKTVKGAIPVKEKEYKGELSEDKQLSNLQYLKLSKLDRQARIEAAGKRGVEALLGDAEDIGINIYPGKKAETFKEEVDRKIDGAIGILREISAKEHKEGKFNKIGYYRSVGYSESEVAAMEAQAKREAEKKTKELSEGKKAEGWASEDMEHALIAADQVQSDSNR